MIISINKKLLSSNPKEENLKLSAANWEPLDVDFTSPDINSTFFQQGIYFAQLFDYSEHKSHTNTDFSTISAIVLDYDGKVSTQTPSTRMVDVVKAYNFKAFVVSGPSYEASRRDSYRLIIPLAEAIDAVDFVTLINLFNEDSVYGKGLDMTCAALRFWAPTNGGFFFTNDSKTLANIQELFTILNYKKGVKKLKELYDKTSMKTIETVIKQEDKIHDIFDKYPNIVPGRKEQCICPFCDPANRKNPNNNNAFVSKTASNRIYLYCSSENKTYWKDMDYNALLKPFISYTDSVYKFGLGTNNRLTISKIGKEKFHILTGTTEKVEAAKAWKTLIMNKHFEDLPNVEYHCSIDFKEQKIKTNNNPIVVEIPAIGKTIEDNDFIENYINETFKEHAEFIKNWMALFAFTNFRKLPTLVFTGDRSTGKTTFAQVMGNLFPGQSSTVNNIEREFTGFVENKLLIIDESIERGKNQYSIIKLLAGSEYLEINKKYKEPFLVRNNLNLIITSNDMFPLYVEAAEIPKEESKNQFFVYHFSPLPEDKLDATVQTKLLNRLVHWLDTVGRARFAQLSKSMDKYRYCLPVPITPELKKTFETSLSPMAYKASACVEDWKDSITKLDSECIDNDFIKAWAKGEKIEFVWLLKEMRKLNLIGEQRAKRLSNRIVKMHKIE